MNAKQKLEYRIDQMSKDIYGYKIVENFKDFNLNKLTPKSNSPTYLAPILSFLVWLSQNTFDDAGNFRIKLLKWPAVIQQVSKLIISLIN